MSERMKKRGGRPNRGGGRTSQPRGGKTSQPRGGKRGRGGKGQAAKRPSLGGDSRKGGANAAAYGYDDDTVVYAKEEYSPEQSMTYTKKRDVKKVPMQRLYMSVENQEMVKEMLQDLHEDAQIDKTPGDFEEDGEEEYNDYNYAELDWRANDQYWMSDQNLVVEELQHNIPSSSNSRKAEALTFTKMALTKLQRYGFDKDRCQKALRLHEGDIGQSLEYLLSECFDLRLHVSDRTDEDDEAGDYGEFESESRDTRESEVEENDASWEDILEQRTEEMTALSSIYESSFRERIPNKVWTISLELPHLTEMVQKQQLDSVKDANVKEVMIKRQTKSLQESRVKKIEKNLCSFFQKGHCRFGGQCRYKHQAIYEEAEEDAGASGATGKEDTVPDRSMYQLEIRFPEKNKYPYEVPFIAFSGTNPMMSNDVCLKISARLLKEAYTLEETGLPAVFSLVSVLEDTEELSALLTNPPLEFSLPESMFSSRNSRTVREKRQPELPAGALGNDNVRPLSHLLAEVDEMRDKEGLEDDDEGVGMPACRDEPDPETSRQGPDVRKNKPGRKDATQRRVDPHQVEKVNRRLKEKFKRTQERSSYQRMVAYRRKLPAWDKQDKIVKTLHDNQVLVVSGMTGCGKTTQVPQFLLDDSLLQRGNNVYNIICTQPRRISAMAVAERVADERTEKAGGIVGYQIRLESKMSADTRLQFCTTGILLRRLESDHLLEGVTHIIIDEVHERSEESDFLMLILRDLLQCRRNLKVILMSATMNADMFSDYFHGCPVIDIPGRTFPVDQFFLEDALGFTGFVMDSRSPFARSDKRPSNKQEQRGGAGRPFLDDLESDLDPASHRQTTERPRDNIRDENLTVRQLFARYPDYDKSAIKTMSMMSSEKINNDLIEAIIEWIVGGDHEYPRGGAILVFLPGMAEISSLLDQLLSNPRFGGQNRQKFRLIPLHSMLSSEEQKVVFSRPQEGVTKIVLSTNIAETSVTIDDVVFVIDGGRMKEKRFDASKGMESLDLVWVSRANAMQRKGRAGRVAAGVCFHLFSGHHYEFHLAQQPVPEIHRVPLEQLVLRIKILDIFKGQDVERVMNKLIEPPPAVGLITATRRLQDLGALDTEKDLTPLGYHLAFLPVDVRIGKLMLFGAIFRCLDPALTIAATLSFKSPFVAPFDKRDEADKKKKEFAIGNSDHLTMLSAYKAWTQASRSGGRHAYSFCRENFLSIKTMQMLASMKRQFAELLSDIGFIQEGLTVRDMERRSRGGGDGVLDATGHETNSNSDNMKLVAAILVAALYPNVVQVMMPESKYTQTVEGAIAVKPKAEELRFKTKSVGYVSIHPSSVNFQLRYFESPYMVFHEKVKTSKIYIRDCTMVSVYPLLLFGGGSMSVDLDRGNFVLSVDDGWIRFMATSHMVAELVRELRLELKQLLQDKIENPLIDLVTCPRGSRIIPTIVKLIATQ